VIPHPLRRPSPRWRLPLPPPALLPVLAVLLAGPLACGEQRTAAPDEAGPQSAAPAATSPGEDPAVARMGGETIRRSELEEHIRDRLYERETGRMNPTEKAEFEREHLENMIDARLLEEESKRTGRSVDELLQESAGAPRTVSDEEVRRFYEENKGRMGGATYEQIAPRIRQYLEGQARTEAKRQAYDRLVGRLREEAGVDVLLEIPRVEVEPVGPARGPDDAPVTIVEFSDFQCPFCRRARPVVERILETYPDRVRLVYRHLPLESIHPRARPAAEAAACASEQGRFWEYHDLLFDAPDGLEDDALEGYAEKLGLDLEAFRSCLAEGRGREVVDRDLEAAVSAGISGTPAFVINGILLSGAQPFEEFRQVIDRELARGG